MPWWRSSIYGALGSPTCGECHREHDTIRVVPPKPQEVPEQANRALLAFGGLGSIVLGLCGIFVFVRRREPDVSIEAGCRG